MEALNIKWSKTFLRQSDAIAEWYDTHMGRMSRLKFIRGMEDTVRTLSHSPRIGMLDERRSHGNRKYYSFLSHPHYRIIYRFTSKTLFVIAIHDTRMKH